MRYAVSVPLCAAMVFSVLCGSISLASVRERAAEGIEQHRKREAEIVLKLPDGSLLGNANVEIRQISHDFRFGNYIRPRHYENEQYLARFQELFNSVQLLEFNWGQYEPDEGQPLVKSRRDFIENWCLPHGLNHFYGHMLVWTRQYGEYPRTGLPLWLFRYDAEKQYELLKQRIQREVSTYSDLDLIFDVVNEAVHCRVWGDWDKDSYAQNQQPEPLESIVPYVRDALTWAHEANPNARLLINDYRVIVEGRFRRQYKALIDRLLDENVPLAIVGIQGHEPYKGKYWYSPEELWSTYELFGTDTGLPIHITEYLNVSDPREEIRGPYRSGRWSEEAQADAVEEFYRISFGHPSVEAIYYFGLTDADVWMEQSGLLDERYRPKPAWHRLKKLLTEEWTTQHDGKADMDGRLVFRGFYGEYRVQVRHAGETYEFGFHLKKGGPDDFEFVVGDERVRDQ